LQITKNSSYLNRFSTTSKINEIHRAKPKKSSKKTTR